MRPLAESQTEAKKMLLKGKCASSQLQKYFQKNMPCFIFRSSVGYEFIRNKKMTSEKTFLDEFFDEERAKIRGGKNSHI